MDFVGLVLATAIAHALLKLLNHLLPDPPSVCVRLHVPVETEDRSRPDSEHLWRNRSPKGFEMTTCEVTNASDCHISGHLISCRASTCCLSPGPKPNSHLMSDRSAFDDCNRVENLVDIQVISRGCRKFRLGRSTSSSSFSSVICATHCDHLITPTKYGCRQKQLQGLDMAQR